ncbi:MAG: HutD family protein [Luteimonas sp.]
MSGSTAVRHLRAHDARRVRWHNGLGWTREIHAEQVTGDDAWSWRLSIADIDRAAEFSRFDGVERELMLLSGDGLVLQFGDGQVTALQPPHARLRFDGARGLSGEPAGAGVSALNLMWRPLHVAASTWHRPLVGTMVVFVDPGDCWVVHVLAGHVRLADIDAPPAERGDTLLLRAEDGRRRQVLDGGGELLLARLARSGQRSPSEAPPAAP